MSLLEKAPLAGFDTETTGLDPMTTARLVGMSFAPLQATSGTLFCRIALRLSRGPRIDWDIEKRRIECCCVRGSNPAASKSPGRT
jgi:hypothetical protein